MTEQLSRAYVLWGDDAISRNEVVRSFRMRMLARPGGEFNLVEFRAPDLSATNVIAACDTVPFLSDRRLVILHQLLSWRPRSSARRHGEGPEPKDGGPLKAEREAILAYLPGLAPHTTLVLVEGALSPTARAELQKALPRARSDVRAFPAPQGPELERWLARRAQARGGRLAPRVAALIREHGPPSLEGLDSEVAKLVTYAGGEPVSVDHLNKLLPGAEMIVFTLLDAVAEGRVSDALTTLRKLFRQGVRAEELSPQVIALYRRLLVCRLAMAERADTAEVQRLHGVKLIEKLRAQARGLPTERLEQALQRLLAFDRELKRGEVEPESGLETLIADLAELARPVGRR